MGRQPAWALNARRRVIRDLAASWVAKVVARLAEIESGPWLTGLNWSNRCIQRKSLGRRWSSQVGSLDPECRVPLGYALKRLAVRCRRDPGGQRPYHWHHGTRRSGRARALSRRTKEGPSLLPKRVGRRKAIRMERKACSRRKEAGRHLGRLKCSLPYGTANSRELNRCLSLAACRGLTTT